MRPRSPPAARWPNGAAPCHSWSPSLPGGHAVARVVPVPCIQAFGQDSWARSAPADFKASPTLLHDRRSAAVHVDRRAADVASTVRCQEGDQVGGLVGLADAPKWTTPQLRHLLVEFVQVAAGRLRPSNVLVALDQADADGVDR